MSRKQIRKMYKSRLMMRRNQAVKEIPPEKTLTKERLPGMERRETILMKTDPTIIARERWNPGIDLLIL